MVALTKAKDEKHEKDGIMVLNYKITGMSAKRQIFVKNDPSSSESLILGSVPFFIQNDQIEKLFEQVVGSKGGSSVVMVEKRGDDITKGYSGAKVVFDCAQSANRAFARCETIRNLQVDQPGQALGLAQMTAAYNARFSSHAEDLTQAEAITRAHKQALQQRKEESKVKKGQADEEGWVTVTAGDRRAFRAPKLAAVQKRVKKQKRAQITKKPQVQLI